MDRPIIPNDPRIALQFDETNPLAKTAPSVAIPTNYEPIYLPDGSGEIPSVVDAGAVALERLGPSPQIVQDQSVVFPSLPVSAAPPLPYGQKLPAPELPTGMSPVVPSFRQPIVQSLTAPRYVPEFSVQGSVQPAAYPVAKAANGVSTTSPAPFAVTPPAMVSAPGFAPVDSPYAPPVTPKSNPVAWYQSIPSAPGAPAVSYWGSVPGNQLTAVRMDNGSVAYVPAPSPGSSVHMEAPSAGDTRYTQARAADGSTVYVARGFPLPAGVTAIPGVTNTGSVHMEAPSAGDTCYTQAQAADGSIVSVARGFPLPAGVTPIPGVTDLSPNGLVTVGWPHPALPPTTGIPGWVLPAAGIGLVLFFLLRKKKEEGK